MLRKILKVFVVIMALFCVVVAMQPSDFSVSRSITISAPPQAAFAHVNTLKDWEAWSPWAKLDPNATMTYEGPASGIGAVSGWDGNSEVGKGKMTIIESVPNQRVGFTLDFKEPFEGTSNAEFTFAPVGDQTTVTWSMYGHNNFIAKAMGLLMNCEKMVGDQFEKGLTQLKAVAEKTTPP